MLLGTGDGASQDSNDRGGEGFWFPADGGGEGEARGAGVNRASFFFIFFSCFKFQDKLSLGTWTKLTNR